MRGAKIMDSYTHLYIENLRPYVAMLDEEVKAARQVLSAEEVCRGYGRGTSLWHKPGTEFRRCPARCEGNYLK